jgi:hypothetical protein
LFFDSIFACLEIVNKNDVVFSNGRHHLYIQVQFHLLLRFIDIMMLSVRNGDIISIYDVSLRIVFESRDNIIQNNLNQKVFVN